MTHSSSRWSCVGESGGTNVQSWLCYPRFLVKGFPGNISYKDMVDDDTWAFVD